MTKEHDMTRTRRLIRSAALLLCLSLAGTVWALGEPSLANTETVEMGNIENLSISYGGDTVILRESETPDLVIKEYLSRNNRRYYARITRSGDTVQIKRGRRPWFSWGFWEARIEIYLPRSFRGNLRLANSSGSLSGDADLRGYKSVDISVSSGDALLKNISGESVSVHVASGKLDISAIEGSSFVSVSSGRLQIGNITGQENHIKVSSGRLRIGAVEGRSIIDISSGNMTVDRIHGKTDVDISSGGLELGNFSGEGTFEASSGDLKLELKDLEEDLRFRVSSGNITVTIPSTISFNLDAVTKSGTVRVNENGNEVLKVSGNSTVLRPLGPSPERTIFARTSSGHLTINRR
jgi:hypothetical protein